MTKSSALAVTILRITGEPIQASRYHTLAAYRSVRRGSAGAYQRWANMVGDQRFSFPNLLPFIKRAFETLGLKNINGLSSGTLEGFSEFTVTVDPRSGTRSSSETSFLQQAQSRTNLQVYQRTLAKKVNIENETATSVAVDTAGKIYYLSATMKVILPAGALCLPHPQLLRRIC